MTGATDEMWFNLPEGVSVITRIAIYTHTHTHADCCCCYCCCFCYYCCLGADLLMASMCGTQLQATILATCICPEDARSPKCICGWLRACVCASVCVCVVSHTRAFWLWTTWCMMNCWFIADNKGIYLHHIIAVTTTLHTHIYIYTYRLSANMEETIWWHAYIEACMYMWWCVARSHC